MAFLRCTVFTIDPNFIGEDRGFYGKIDVLHNSSWATRMDMCELGFEQIRFIFPKQNDGRQEVLIAYIDGNILLRLSNYFE